MKLKKINRRWVIEGNGQEWTYKKTFRTKREAELAKKVFKKGGRVSDYWKAKRKHPKRKMNAWRVREQLQ